MANQPSARPLEAQVLHRGRELDRFEVSADSGDPAALEAVLTAWLAGHRWHPGRWREFEMVIRQPGGSAVLAKVRAPA